ncbi:hypothetical protein V6N13_032338 [Hibiscus sabdariffa]
MGWKLRMKGMPCPLYGSQATWFTIVIHYGGIFSNARKLKYSGKRVAYFDFCVVDEMSLFEVIHMIESLRIKSAVKVFRAVPNGAFKVLPLTDDNDVLNMVVELPKNRNVHLYLVEQDHAFLSEPNDEHEPQTNDEPQLIDSDSEFGTEPNIEINVESGTDPNDEPAGKDTESGSEPNVETNVESGTDPNDEPVGSDTESGSEPNVETNAESETDPNDETVGSDTESETKCESGFEEDDFSVDEEDDSETESVVHTPQFTEHSTQFETHFEEARVGMIFANREVLKKAVINYGLQNRLHLKFKRNDIRRVNVICKPGCPWALWASRQNPSVAEDLTWQIKTLKNEHSCSKYYGKINLSSRTIAEKYLHFFVSDINFSIHSLHEAVKKDFISPVHQSKLYRARDIAIGIIEGKHKDQYSRIYDYLGELRPIICLDGCHLKGYHGGHLLTAVGIGANDCIYPIAFAAVESECHSSWCWFCVRHLYNNFKGKHKGKALKDSFWKAATSTYMREFQVSLAEMESLSPKAFEWLKNVDPKFWSKSHFSTRSKCDMLLNNLCESFNKCVLEARSRPIITMLEGI